MTDDAIVSREGLGILGDVFRQRPVTATTSKPFRNLSFRLVFELGIVAINNIQLSTRKTGGKLLPIPRIGYSKENFDVVTAARRCKPSVTANQLLFYCTLPPTVAPSRISKLVVPGALTDGAVKTFASWVNGKGEFE
jgi:hypothetical protein